MRAKVPRCYSLGIKSSTTKPFDLSLALHGQGVPFVSNSPIKVLGYRVQVPMDNQAVRTSLLPKLMKLTKVATTLIEDDDSNDSFSAVVSLERQTGALHVVEEEAAAQWASALEHLTSSELNFTLNACQDSLPHNSNLAIWKGHPSECKLCGERQSLLHVLCNCPVALQLRRCNTRHDEVLQVIFNLL